MTLIPVKSRFASARSKKTVYAAAGKSRAFNVVVVIVGDGSVAQVGEQSLVVYVCQWVRLSAFYAVGLGTWLLRERLFHRGGEI